MASNNTPRHRPGRNITPLRATLDTSIVPAQPEVVNPNPPGHSLARLLDGIQARRRKQVSPDDVLDWACAILRNLIVLDRRQQGGRP